MDARCALLFRLPLKTSGFFSYCAFRYNDPSYVKYKKVEILASLCQEDSLKDVLEELRSVPVISETKSGCRPSVLSVAVGPNRRGTTAYGRCVLLIPAPFAFKCPSG